MSALADAIRSARPRTDLGTTSPFGGLRRRHARTIDVVAQSVAAIAPAGVLLVHPSALYARSGSFAFLDIVLTIAIVLAIGGVIGVFGRRVSSTGSLYTYTARGLGPAWGLVGGSALAIGYLSVALSTLFSGSERIAGLISGADSAPTWSRIAVVAAAGTVIAAVLALGLRVSTRILLVLETVAVVTVIGLSLAALSVTGWDLSLLVPRPEHFSLQAITAGVTFALIGFVGFESGAGLGPETRRPFAAVPRGVLLSVGAAAAVMLVGTAAQLSLVAEDPRASSIAGADGLAGFADLIVGVSFLACALAMTNAATRVAFALSREGIIPRAFGRTTAKGVPAAGALILTAVVTVVPIGVLALGGTRGDLRLFTTAGSTVGFLIAYGLVCLAAPVFLARIGELTLRSAVLALAPLLALSTILVTYILGTDAAALPGLATVLGVLGALVVAGGVRLLRRPGLAERVGMHDWAVASDTIASSSGRDA